MSQKVAIVTGGSSGIGLELVKRLLAREYALVSVSRNASTGAPAVALTLVDGDVGDPATAERAIQATHGKLDLLVNNAGIFISQPFTEYTAQDYAQLLSTNLSGFVHMNHAVMKTLSPANRLGTTAEIADAALYLESASFVSGEVLHVDGGAHAGKWS